MVQKTFPGPGESRAAGNLSALPELSGNDVQRPEPGRAGCNRCSSACGHHDGAASRRARFDGLGRESAFDSSPGATGGRLDGRDRGHGPACRLDDIGCKDIWRGPAISGSSRNRPTRSPRSAAQTRDSMKAWIDSDNIIHMGGRPRFVIGLYDTTGFGYRTSYFAPRLTGDSQGADQSDDKLFSQPRPHEVYPFLHRSDGAVWHFLPGDQYTHFSRR